MKKFPSIPLLAALACLLSASAQTGAPESGAPGGAPTRVRDAQGMYARASSILRDRSIKNVSSVPAMLENCVHDGYIPAAYLLMDVYEGKYAGLAAQPQKAAKLAYSLAAVRVPKDETAEARALRHEAMFRYASYCERGLGCPKSPAVAYKWMFKAAAEGMGKARVELARYLMGGIGCKPHPKQALRLLREQAVKDPKASPHLFFYLGHMYFHGIGMPKPDRAMALRFYECGDELGDDQATNNLAAMYERGIVVSKNTDMALRLYKRAAAAGNKEASANMQRLGYKAGEGAGEQTTVSQRVCNASLRVVNHLPVTPRVRELLLEFFISGSSSPGS